tara:strand:+ start:48 stop:500 length:453 start_codon:yes stop_codon:yes gene_type:complete
MLDEFILNTKEARLIQIDYKLITGDLNEELLSKMSPQEQINTYNLALLLPSRSCEEDDELYWDQILVDEFILSYLEQILNKRKIKYFLTDITKDYYKKSSYLDLDFIKDIDGFMDTLLTIDDVLDRINDVGLDKINLLELSFLERNSSKF